jgi:site-specific recombinase XerD
MRDAASARQLTFGLVQEINTTDIRSAGISMTLAQLADHFHQRELGRSNGRISCYTKRAYQGYLDKWIVPRWGGYLLPNIKVVEVELWLRNLERAAGTCCKIRNVMSVLFNHARRYDLCDRNPIRWVRQSAKRRSTPEVLTSGGDDETRTRGLCRDSQTVSADRPYLAQQIMQRHILPVARKLGITKRIGWHTFRHTYSTLLRSTGAELKIMRELLRHSTIRVTLDTYTQAVTTEKRNAQDAVVALLCPQKIQ